MTNEDFDKLLDRRLEKTREVLGKKGEEYASDVDRLHNFKAAGRMDGESPEKALWGMLKKHLVSVMDMANGITSPIKCTDEYIDEKIGDTINYFILLEARLKERNLEYRR